MTDSTIAPDNTPIPALPPEKVRAAEQVEDVALFEDAL